MEDTASLTLSFIFKYTRNRVGNGRGTFLSLHVALHVSVTCTATIALAPTSYQTIIPRIHLAILNCQ